MRLKLFVFLFLSVPTFATSFLLKEQRSATGEWQLLELKLVPQTIRRDILLRELPEIIIEGPDTTNSAKTIYRERLLPQNSPEIASLLLHPAARKIESVALPGLEVRSLITQGPSSNRIDLTFLAEGYTEAEREKFFADSHRLASDLFVHQAFASYLSLFNIHAVFVASSESGVSDRQARDTAFGLYRSPAGSKRAILPGNQRKIDQALAQAPDTDYPILLVNDDYYGGLGGKYAITTRSHNSGSMVLRHELGHNFGNVGEEYDGGSVYTGANFSFSRRLPWQHWIEGEAQLFHSRFLTGSYQWKNLARAPALINFRYPEGNFFFAAKISSVGWASEDEVGVELQGQELALNGIWTEDRSFFSLQDPIDLQPGSYQMRIFDRGRDQDNVFAFAMLYAHPRDIPQDPNFIGGFSVFDANQEFQGYRPSFSSCLMRDMRHQKLCVVDQENLWFRFLQRVSILDTYQVERLANQQRRLHIEPSVKGHGQYWLTYLDANQRPLTRIRLNSSPVSIPAEARYAQLEFQSPEIRKADSAYIKTLTL